MTNKKKITAILAGAALAMSVPMAAFAESQTINNSTGSTEIKVTGNYVGRGGGTSYKVEISWGDMKYNYSTAATEWDTEQHKYVPTGTDGGGFTPANDGSDRIDVKNSSNIGIIASFSFAGASADSANILTDITGGFSDASQNTIGDGLITLETAAKDSAGNPINSQDTQATGTPSTGTCYLVINGGALAENAADVSLGTVTVTISADPAAE